MKQALLNFHLEEFKGVIRSRKLKDRQHNDQKKLELSGLSLCHSPFILLWGNLIQNLPQVLPTKFWIILAKQFQRRRFLEIDQSKTRIACGSHVC